MRRAQEDPAWLWYKPVPIEKYFDGIHCQFLSLDLIPMPHVIHQRKRGPPDELEHQIYKAGEQEAIVSYNVLLSGQLTDRICSSLSTESSKITDGPPLRSFGRKNVLRPRTKPAYKSSRRGLSDGAKKR